MGLKLNLIVAAILAFSPGSGVSLPAFSMQAETTAIAAAFTASGQSVSTARQYGYDKMVRLLKGGAGNGDIWAKLVGFWLVGDTAGQTLVNLKNPGTYNLTVGGAPVFTAPATTYAGAPVTGAGYVASSTAMYLDTGITLSQMAGYGSFSFGVYTGASSVVGVDFGAKDSTGGCLIYAGNTSGAPSAQACTTGGNFGAVGDTNGQWLTSCVRDGSAGTTSVYHGGRQMGTALTESAKAVTTGTTRMRFMSSGAATSYSAKPFLGGYVANAALTQAEVDLIYRVMTVMIQTISVADVYINEPGYAPATPSHQVLVYGWGSQSVKFALEAARQGLDVALVGGWRDRTIAQFGGVSANGLGRTDITSLASIGGLARHHYYRCNRYDGITDSGSGDPGSGARATQCRTANLMFRQDLDKTRTGVSGTITVYATGGIVAVNKSGTRIQSCRFLDGRVISASYFWDGSYEGDLLSLAGVSFTASREAAGTGTEALNGFRGVQLTQRPNKSSTYYDISPFVNSTDASQGYIYGVNSAAIGSVVGAADDRVQAYNYRITTQGINYQKMPFPSAAPTGYAAANYEFHARFAAALVAGGGAYTADDAWLRDATQNSTYDWNNAGPVGSDFLNRSNDYTTAADYSAREVFIQNLRNWMMGYVYWCTTESDTRIASTACRTTMASYGLPMDCYLEPYPGDAAYWPTVPYIREFRRLVGDFVMNGNDLTATSGSAVRSAEAFSCANYTLDSHNNQRYAYNNAGVWTTLAEGTISQAIGGTNSMIPIPRGVGMPKASEATNLGVLFCFSATHVAFSSLRMEAPSMAFSQAAAIQTKLAIVNGNQGLQAVAYASIKTALQASATFSGEVAPTDAQLPSTN